jgi:hypothetical protein
MHPVSAVAYALVATWVTLSGQTSEDEAVEIAKDVLQAKLGLSVTEVRVRQAESVEWSDSSLGCPEEGVSYRPEIVAGYRLVLETEGKFVRVHVGGGRAVICGDPVERSEVWTRETAPERMPPKQEEENLVTGEVPARVLDPILGDVTKRTGAKPEDIEVVKAEAIVWKDGSLGCTRPGREHTEAPVPGYGVILEYEGERFDYRAMVRGFFLLCERPSPPIGPTQ